MERDPVPMLRMATAPGAVVSFAYRGEDFAPKSAKHDELLAAARAGQPVELDITIRAYRQKEGERDLNNVRVRDGGLHRMGLSGRDKPFMRDHLWRDVLARAGTVTASKRVVAEDGASLIMQDLHIVKPWAVEGVLDGTIDRFSIGGIPRGSIECSVCNADYRDCWHWPGQTVETEGGDSTIVEWVLEDLDLVETSAVSVPSVQEGTGIDEIKALFSLNRRSHRMPLVKLAAVLALAATSTEEDLVDAVTSLRAARSRAELELSTERAAHDKTRADSAAEHTELVALRAASKQRDIDSIVEEGQRTGKIPPTGDKPSEIETSIRDYASTLGVKAAREFMTTRMSAINPVGQGAINRQEAAAPDSAVVEPKVLAMAKRMGISDEDLKKYTQQIREQDSRD